MTRLTGLLAWVGMLVLPAAAFAASGTESASFLDIPVGAAPAALGGAYTALAADLYAPIWNPAGLGFLDSTQLGGQHLSYLDSIHYDHAGVVTRLKRGMGLGVSVQYLGSGSIPGADSSGAPQPDYSSFFGSYNLAYGQSLGEHLSLGVTGKLINAKISDVGSSAYAADLGALYKANGRTTLAATVTNLGTRLKFLNDDHTLPIEGHLAAAYHLNACWLGALEGVFSKDGSSSAHLGLQWQPYDFIAIRTGYKTDTIQELGAFAGTTLGVGLKFWGQELAYAWVPMGELGDTQYVSMVLRFGQTGQDKNLLRASDIHNSRSANEMKGSQPRGGA